MTAVLTIGPYTFRPSAKLLLDPSGRKKVRLTEKETAILKYLYRAGDQAIGRDTLLGEVWGYNAGVTTHTWRPMCTDCVKRSSATRRGRRSW